MKSYQSLSFARAAALSTLASLSLALLGCPENAAPAGSELKAPCKEVGQRCEFSPGKLGSCVMKDDCHAADCFVCQSQH